MSLRNLKVQEKREDGTYSILINSRLRDEALLFESGVIAELSAAESDEMRKGFTKLNDVYGCLGVLKLSQGNLHK